MPVTQDEFRAALSRFPSGVTVVTTRDTAGRLHGITVSAFCSVSLDPPMILVCIEKTTGSHSAMLESKGFAVNILSEDQIGVSEHFASNDPDKFDKILFTTGITHGLPLLKDVAVAMECVLQAAYEGGDHTIFVGLVESVHVFEADPLVYFHSDYRSLGN